MRIASWKLSRFLDLWVYLFRSYVFGVSKNEKDYLKIQMSDISEKNCEFQISQT